MQPSTRGGATRARRLIFEYEDTEIRLVSEKRVEMAPLIDNARMPAAAGGFRYELQNEAGNVLFRNTTASPFRESTEVWTGDPERPLAQQTVRERRKGTFVVTVPDYGEPADLVLFDSRPVRRAPGEAPLSAAEARAAATAREIFRMRLQ